MPRKTVLSCLFLLLASTCALSGRGEETAPPQTPPRDQLLEETWYLLSINGQPAGRSGTVVEKIARNGSFLYRTRTLEAMSISAGPATISLSSETEFLETEDGKPVSLRIVETQGNETKITKGRFENGKLLLTIRAGSLTTTRTIEVPGDVVLGYSEEKLVRGKGFKPGATYSYYSFMPDIGLVEVTRKVAPPVQVALPVSGRVEVLHPVRISGVIPGMSVTDYRDASGRTVLVEMPIMGMKITMERMSKETLARFLKSSARIDIAGLRYLDVDFPHPRPREVTRAVFIVSSADGEPFEDLEQDGGGVTAERLPGGSMRLTVSYPDKFANSMETPPPPPDETALQAGPYIRPDIPDLRRKALDLAANSRTYLETARKIEKWVRAHMRFVEFGENFSSAEKVWEKRRGDCTETAVLLASLLRAAGIPTRLASGVAMLNGRLGFHMWVEVYGGKDRKGEAVWIPFDSAVYNPYRVDATHIRFGAASDDALMMGRIASLVQLIGRLKVSAEEYTAGGLTVKAGEPWWEDRGGNLLHKGFLFSLPLPAGWKVTGARPSGALSLALPSGETMRLTAKEIPPEYSFRLTLSNIRAAGFATTSPPRYGKASGRRWMSVSAIKGASRFKALYIRDGDALLKFTTDAGGSALIEAVRKNIRFLSGRE